MVRFKSADWPRYKLYESIGWVDILARLFYKYLPILMFLELKKSSRLRLQVEVLSIISMVALNTALMRFHFS